MADITIDAVTLTTAYAAVQEHVVWTSPTTGYAFMVDSTSQLVYYKSTDSGGSFSGPTAVSSTSDVTQFSIWFDKWTNGDTGTEIHCAYSVTGNDDTMYRALDTSDDSLGTEVIAYAATSVTGSITYANYSTSIVVARGGNIYISAKTTTTEHKFVRSTDSGANFTERADVHEGASGDRCVLQPGSEADNNDIWAFFWDSSASEVSIKVYDNSGNSWAETSISGGMTISHSAFLGIYAVHRHSDNHSILFVWNNYDSATADLKVWDITNSGTVTAKTDVLTDSAESACAAPMINQQNDDLYCAYIRGSGLGSSVGTKYKKSDDGGGTWGSETAISEGTDDDLRGVFGGSSVGDDGGRFQPCWHNDDLDDFITNKVNSVEISAAAVGGRIMGALGGHGGLAGEGGIAGRRGGLAA